MSDTQLLALAEMEIKDQWEKLRVLRLQVAILRKALVKIRDEDYRGNQHSSHFIAKRALEETE